jgi:segregation and condensation protein A
MEFTVKLDRYEGPYTKLLDLIGERKLSITEISLVSVADDYIAYIRSLEEKDNADISQFILVASTLMLMKAKSLLPSLIYTDEEEKEVNDLEKKLELHKALMHACGLIRPRYGKTPLYERERVVYKGNAIFVPDQRVTVQLLQSVALLTLSTFIVPKQIVHVAIEQAVRIEHVIEKLLERVYTASSLAFTILAVGATTFEEKKKVLIVNFLALLELIRSGTVQAEQHVDGGDIYMSKIDQSSMLQ